VRFQHDQPALLVDGEVDDRHETVGVDRRRLAGDTLQVPASPG